MPEFDVPELQKVYFVALDVCLGEFGMCILIRTNQVENTRHGEDAHQANLGSSAPCTKTGSSELRKHTNQCFVSANLASQVSRRNATLQRN